MEGAGWLIGDLELRGEGVKVTPTNAEPTTEENDALISDELLGPTEELGGSSLDTSDDDAVVVVVVVVILGRDDGVRVTPTNAIPAEEEYEPLTSDDEL